MVEKTLSDRIVKTKFESFIRTHHIKKAIRKLKSKKNTPENWRTEGEGKYITISYEDFDKIFGKELSK